MDVGVRWIGLCLVISTASGIRVGRSAPSRELLDHTEIHNIETLKDIREFERQQRLALIEKYNDTTDTQPQEEREMRLALNDLFWATSGYEWTSHLRFAGQEWRKPSNYCEWYGATCDEFGILRQVHLSFNNLIGTIPSTIGKLTTLTELFLDHNEQLSGTIPDLSNMTQLVYLDLSACSLEGEPNGLINSQLPALNWIDVSLNKDNYVPEDPGDPTHQMTARSMLWTNPSHTGKLTVWEGTGSWWSKPNVTHLIEPWLPDRRGRIETRPNTTLGSLNWTADAYYYRTTETGRG